MRKHLIICGNNPTLLATRKLVLEHAGLCPETFLGIANLPSLKEGAFVLCHTLNEVEKSALIQTIRAQRPEAPILVIGDCDPPQDDVLGHGDGSLFEVSAFVGTEAFIAAAQKLMQ